MTALLEIDLSAIAENWRALDSMHGGATSAVIKADAYGLGAAQVVPKLWDAGCRDFFVAHFSEAAAVRPALMTMIGLVSETSRAADRKALASPMDSM